MNAHKTDRSVLSGKENFAQVSFVLGCERSGSTWLSNVVDSHPDVELFMEPFAGYAGIFPGIPDRNLIVDGSHEALVQIVREGYAKLHSLKYPLFYRRGRHPCFVVLDRNIVNLYESLGRSFGFRVPKKIDQFQLLNLNTKKIALAHLNRKNRQPKSIVTKELRLNFKVRLLDKAFPGARYIIIIRHPGAQSSSIYRLIQNGGLAELNQALIAFDYYIRSSKYFKKYEPLLSVQYSPVNLMDVILNWWLINYDILVETCEELGLKHLIVYHEDISHHPHAGFQKIFDFLGIEYSSSVRNFVEISSKSQKNTLCPVDTYRNSSSYYKNVISNLDEDIAEKIQILFDCANISDKLRRYSNFSLKQE